MTHQQPERAIVRLERERDEARAERDRARAERDAGIEVARKNGMHTRALLAERDALAAQVAAMRAVVEAAEAAIAANDGETYPAGEYAMVPLAEWNALVSAVSALRAMESEG